MTNRERFNAYAEREAEVILNMSNDELAKLSVKYKQIGQVLLKYLKDFHGFESISEETYYKRFAEWLGEEEEDKKIWRKLYKRNSHLRELLSRKVIP